MLEESFGLLFYLKTQKLLIEQFANTSLANLCDPPKQRHRISKTAPGIRQSCRPLLSPPTLHKRN